jgi:radical SAM protein with 4Fe4S-binding SPASM domain
MLSDDVFHSVIDQLHKELLYLTFYFQGEPYLHPKFLEYVTYASNHNIYTATSTNGHYLDDQKAEQTVRSGLDRLIISIDGTTQDTYTSYRIGGKLEKVLEGTKNIVRWKKKLKSSTPHIIFQFLVVRQNEHQVEEVKQLAEEFGVNEVVLKTAQIYDYENGSDLIPENDKYTRYRKGANGKYTIKNPLLNECWKMWQGCVITWDGKIVPCCFDKDAHHSMGTVSDTSFKEIWNGPGYRSFRENILQGRDKIEMCRNCTEGSEIFA